MMKRLSRYFKILMVAFLFILICRIFYLDFKEKNSIDVDDLIAVVLFLFGLRLILIRSRSGQYLVLLFILMSVCKLIKWDIILSSSNYTSSASITIGALNFNAFGALLLLIYCLINGRGLLDGLIWLRYGSESEQQAHEDKMVTFYYNKFNSSTSDEFDSALNMFESYPREAQIALNKIKSERGI